MIIDLRGFGALAPGAGQPVVVTEPVVTYNPSVPPGTVFVPTGEGQLTADGQAGLARSAGIPPSIGSYQIPPAALIGGPAFDLDFMPRWKQANEIATKAEALAHQYGLDPELRAAAVAPNDAVAKEMNEHLMHVLTSVASSWDGYATAVAERAPLDHINNLRSGAMWWSDRATEHLGVFIVRTGPVLSASEAAIARVLKARADAIAAAEEAARLAAEEQARLAAEVAEEEARVAAEVAAAEAAARAEAIVQTATAAGADPQELQAIVQRTEEAIAQGVPPEAALAQALSEPSGGIPPVVKIAGLTVGGLVLLKLLLK